MFLRDLGPSVVVAAVFVLLNLNLFVLLFLSVYQFTRGAFGRAISPFLGQLFIGTGVSLIFFSLF